MSKINKLVSNSAGFSHHIIYPLIVVVIIAVVGARVYYSENPGARAVSSSCSPDPSTVIEGEPSGATWNGSNKCYVVPLGIKITKPVTIENATFVDPSTSQPTTGYSGMKPIILIQNTSDVTVSNVNVQGEHLDSGYHAKLVGQSGIKLEAADDVTLTNVSSTDTWGDGLELVGDFPKNKTPDTNLTVNNMTITNAGRQGVTVGYVNNSTLNNINIVSSADTGWDFESDLTNVGSGNIVVNNASGNKGVRLIEALQGPITFNNSNFSGNVTITNAAAASKQPVVFNGGTILLHKSYSGTPPAGVWVKGTGNLTFNNVALGRQAEGTKAATGPAWLATDGATLTFNNTKVTSPLGSSDSSSKVTIKS